MLFKVRKGPDGKTVCDLFQKFQQIGYMADVLVRIVGPTHSVVTTKNATSPAAVVQRHQTTSVHRLAAQSGIRPSSTWRILQKTLHIFLYKIQWCHAIPVRAKWQWEDFANVMLDMIDSSGFDINQIWFTDKDNFHLDGVVNGHNWRFWDTKNPYLSQAWPLHSPKITVWTALSCIGIIGPLFLHKTVSTNLYIALLKRFISIQ